MAQQIWNFYENSPMPMPQSSVLEGNINCNYEYNHEQLANNNYNGYYHQMQPMQQYQENFWNNYDQTPPNVAHMMQMQPRESLQNAHSISPLSGDEAHQIVISAPSNYAPVTRRKRARTAFTTEQTQTLERHFKKRPYISRDERKILNEKLGVGDKVIKVWFQNRRLKEKRIKVEELAESLEAEITKEFQNNVSQLNNINYNVSNDLVDISECISSTQGSPTVCGGYSAPIYEPISPPESNEEPLDIHSTFAPVDPEISLRALFFTSKSI